VARKYSPSVSTRTPSLSQRIVNILLSQQEFALSHDHRLASQLDSVALDSTWTTPPRADAWKATNLSLSQTFLPEVGEAAVGRSRHRIFVDASGRGEESRHEIELGNQPSGL
jgi:hypothetical protein